MCERGTGEGVPIIYEDAWLIAVDKPAGLLVHGDGSGAATLADLVRARLERAGQPEAAAQLQPVQRLDVDTTGIVLLSKDKAVQPRLDALVAAHGTAGMRKRYLVVVRGAWPEPVTLVDAAISRDRHDARRMRAGVTGKPARTKVRLLALGGPRTRRLSLLLVELETGRRHQIRVHLASRGAPILGDALYGVPADRRGAGPLMLHALAEDFDHPVTGERLALRAAVPERFSALFPEAERLAADALAR